MADIRPFRGLRPPSDLVARVASPPYDVLSTAEARVLARGNPISFLHICKPEIDLPAGSDPHAPGVYEQGAANLERFQRDGVLIRDPLPSCYIYRQALAGRVQTGVMAAASVAEYRAGLIRKHELTRRDKEDDRTRLIETQNAHAEPVLLAHRARPAIDQLVAGLCSPPPVYDFVADDGVAHTLWTVTDAAALAQLRREFAELECTYVADGHHRSAAASRVAERRGGAPTAAHNFFLAVFFPHNQLTILDYNRVVRDLNGLSEREFLERVGQRFEVAAADEPRPTAPHTFGLLLGGAWRRLTARPGIFPVADPVRSLDVSILQDNLLGPVLGVNDPRTDQRLDFVGGGRGLEELERRCRAGAAVAFALYPTSIEQLFAIADAGQVMPPKSTWFEPKLRSGLVVRRLDE